MANKRKRTPEQYADLIKTVIEGCGEFEPNENPKYLRMAYEDEKVRLMMYFEMGTQIVAVVTVHLALAENYPRLKPGSDIFAIRVAPSTKTTLVYQWENEQVRFYRPGLWIDYLESIITKLQNEWDTIEKLNSTPVDDAALFREQCTEGII
jgi:hypothetical protein